MHKKIILVFAITFLITLTVTFTDIAFASTTYPAGTIFEEGPAYSSVIKLPSNAGGGMIVEHSNRSFNLSSGHILEQGPYDSMLIIRPPPHSTFSTIVSSPGHDGYYPKWSVFEAGPSDTLLVKFNEGRTQKIKFVHNGGTTTFPGGTIFEDGPGRGDVKITLPNGVIVIEENANVYLIDLSGDRITLPEGYGIFPGLFHGLIFCCIDDDSSSRSSGKDPVVIGKWGFIEPGNDAQCANSPNPFDFDNDGFKEHMCYWYHPETKILFVDFNGNKQLDNGYELLVSEGHENPLKILVNSSDFCIIHNCYLWQDKNSNILVDVGEIEPHNMEFVRLHKTSITIRDGLLLEDEDKVFLRVGNNGDLRGSYIYGEFEDKNLGTMYATKPTYWMKGTK